MEELRQKQTYDSMSWDETCRVRCCWFPTAKQHQPFTAVVINEIVFSLDNFYHSRIEKKYHDHIMVKMSFSTSQATSSDLFSTFILNALYDMRSGWDKVTKNIPH
ncbi:hypothetical protein PoB_006154000 [Plakobranchus ocellatus]|uniref:Uncharacterized protein n=1 Tax=Plakobranchus ocellatus TaxID=259542 RepID=A0AAV4CT58_9GAST|nr:hypothetical protein PoB_006154000 [Plakobranchus ocellatus]